MKGFFGVLATFSPRPSPLSVWENERQSNVKRQRLSRPDFFLFYFFSFKYRDSDKFGNLLKNSAPSEETDISGSSLAKL